MSKSFTGENKQRLKEKVALVTGAGGEIGRAIALRLASEGAIVAVNDIDRNQGLETVTNIEEQGNLSEFFQRDISDEQQVKKLTKDVVDKFGGLHILVNNAGLDLNQTVDDTVIQEWQKILSVDLMGAFLCSKYATPYLSMVGSGVIVNIASIHAFATQPGRTAYASAKAGLVGLTRALSLDLGPKGIRVNAVLPGYILTSIWQSWIDRAKDSVAIIEKIAEQHPLKRVGCPEDVASAVSFLVSEDASFITGSTLVVDGGLTSKFESPPI